MKKVYPKNKEHYKKLINFSKRVIKLLNQNKIQTFIYGSFSHFYYTRDSKLKINDIDIFVKEKNYPKILKLLEKEKIKYEYSKEWHTLQIKNGKLKVELDSKDFWYHGNEDFKQFNFFGEKTKIISLLSLKKQYKIAYKKSKDNKEKIKKKIEHLERFLK